MLTLVGKREFDRLEEELLNKFKITGDLKYKYYLGICFSEQYKKITEAVVIFKELKSHVYLFVARYTKTDIEGKIITIDAIGTQEYICNLITSKDKKG